MAFLHFPRPRPSSINSPTRRLGPCNAPYPGAVGDVGQWSTPSNNLVVGQFLVTAVAGNTITLATQLSSVAGTSVNPATWAFTILNPKPSLWLTNTAPWVVPAIGAAVAVPITYNYTGNVNDVITMQLRNANGNITTPSAGTFKVTVIGAFSVTLETVSTPYAGQTLGTGTYSFMAPPTSGVVTPPTAEIPAAGPMVYYQGRLWYAIDRIVSAGDIVGDQSSGTLAYEFRDAILKVTENPLAIGGDGFAVPTNAGSIRGLAFVATQDTALGQGNLIVATRKSLFSLFVGSSRVDLQACKLEYSIVSPK